jgi:DNA-binding response OmpR family regulator
LEESPVILVVEDDPPIQIIVEDALADGGFEPAITASGEEAVTLLKRHKGKYHALVVDIALLGRLDGCRSRSGPERSTRPFPSSTSPVQMPTGGPLRVFRTAVF